MDAKVAERMVAQLFDGIDFTENSNQKPKGTFLKLKESIVINGNHYIPAGTELQFITP